MTQSANGSNRERAGSGDRERAGSGDSAGAANPSRSPSRAEVRAERRHSRAAEQATRKQEKAAKYVSPTNLTPAGFPGSLDVAQTRKLSQFRATLIKEGVLTEGDKMFDSPYELTRFLRARGWELDRAKAMCENTVRWRREFGCDKLIEDFHFEEATRVMQIYPQFNYWTDKGGRPIYIERIGRLDVPKLFKTTDTDRMLRHHVREWEIMIKIKFTASARMHGHYINQTFTVLDLKGINLSMAGSTVRKFIKTLASVDQNNYPEHLGKMFIVNAPWAFKALWTVVKPWLDRRTQKKIDICSDKGTKKLLEWVDADKLPDFLGGTAKEPPTGWGTTDEGPWKEDMDTLKRLLAEGRRTGDMGPVSAFVDSCHVQGPKGQPQAQQPQANGGMDAGVAASGAGSTPAAALGSPPASPSTPPPLQPPAEEAPASPQPLAAAEEPAPHVPPPDLSKLSLASSPPPPLAPAATPQSTAELVDGEEFHDALSYHASPAYH